MAKASSQQQLLFQAVRAGDKECSMHLLEDGVNYNCKDNLGYTPLMWAAYYNRIDVTEVLLYYNANLNAKSQGGHTAIHIAVAKGSVGCLTLLCKAGANLSSRSNAGYNPLHEGSFSGKLECVKILLEYKVQINIKTAEGFTALHLAASKGNLEVCQLLLDSGAGLEVNDSAGRTALHLAASCAHGKPVVDLFLARGANAAKKCMKNMTPMQYAVEFNCTLSISILQLAEGQAKEDTPESEELTKKNESTENYETELSFFTSPSFTSSTYSDTSSPPHSVSSSPSPSPVPRPNGASPTPRKIEVENREEKREEEVENYRSEEMWKEMEQQIVRKEKIIEQLRAEKTKSETSYTQSLKQLVQEIKNLEESARMAHKELDIARSAQKELEATRKKLDVLVAELRTITARHARLCEHVAEMEENRLCKVCFERPIGTVISPCSHCCLCVECTTAVEKKNQKCPICRQPIEKTTLCYFT